MMTQKQIDRIIENTTEVAFNSEHRGVAHSAGANDAIVVTGDWSVAAATGDKKPVADCSGTGSIAAITSRSGVAIAEGKDSIAAATNAGSSTAATGKQAAAVVTGSSAEAEAAGSDSVAVGAGQHSWVKGQVGSALFLVERDSCGEILATWSGIVGWGDVKGDTLYSLQNGRLVERPSDW